MRYKLKVDQQSLQKLKREIAKELNKKMRLILNLAKNEMVKVHRLAVDTIRNSPEIQALLTGGPLPSQSQDGSAIGVIGLHDTSEVEGLFTALELGIGSEIHATEKSVILNFGNMSAIKKLTPLPSKLDPNPPDQGQFGSWALQLEFGEIMAADLEPKLGTGRSGQAHMINVGLSTFVIVPTHFLSKYFNTNEFKKDVNNIFENLINRINKL